MQFTEYNVYDPNGEQVMHKVAQKRSKLGKGWVAMFKKPWIALLNDLTPAQLRIFILLSMKQTYELYVVINIRVIADTLKLSYQSTLEALKSLNDKNLVRRCKLDGITLFVVNPAYTISGANTRDKRMQLWDCFTRLEDLKSLKANGTEEKVAIFSAIRGVIEEVGNITEGKLFEAANIGDKTEFGEGVETHERSDD